MSVNNKKNIRICESCLGSGKINSRYDEHVCSICKGSGRVMYYTWVLEVPFTDGIDLGTIYKADSEIWEKLRQVEKNYK
jgi:DnaJ-class molecular chaperone